MMVWCGVVGGGGVVGQEMGEPIRLCWPKSKANKRKSICGETERVGEMETTRRGGGEDTTTNRLGTEQINIGRSVWNSLSVNIIRRRIRMGERFNSVASLIDRHTCPIFAVPRLFFLCLFSIYRDQTEHDGTVKFEGGRWSGELWNVERQPRHSCGFVLRD